MAMRIPRRDQRVEGHYQSWSESHYLSHSCSFRFLSFLSFPLGSNHLKSLALGSKLIELLREPSKVVSPFSPEIQKQFLNNYLSKDLKHTASVVMKIVRRSYLEGSSQISKQEDQIEVLALLVTQYIKAFRYVLILRAKSHCYFTRLNHKRISPFQFCLPALLGIHRNPRQKDFLKSSEGFLR